jgi:hypothetical protein
VTRLSDNTCVRTQYAYDGDGDGDGDGAGDSDRTATSVWSPPGGIPCGHRSSTTHTWTVNAADQVVSPGWQWDDFNRAISVPSPDSGGHGELIATNNSGKLTYQLRDVEGSVVATATTPRPAPDATTEYDPFGIVRSGSPNVLDFTKACRRTAGSAPTSARAIPRRRRGWSSTTRARRRN